MPIEWSKVMSRLGVIELVVLVAVFFVGVFVGTRYQSATQNSGGNNPSTQTSGVVSGTSSTFPVGSSLHGKTVCQTDADCGPNESCRVTGPLVAGRPSPKTCWPNGQATPL